MKSFIPYKNKKLALKKASKSISKELKLSAKKHIAVLFLVSGGSALKILDNIDPKDLNKSVTIGVLDERYSKDKLVNNFSQFMQTRLYKTANTAKCKFIDTRIQNNETHKQLCLRFELAIKNWRKHNLNGKIIITQGMGVDGHTSGVMPFPENPDKFKKLFLNPNVWAVSYNAGNKNQYPLRITTTLEFLKYVDDSFLFACGNEKIDAFKRTFSANGNLANTPARIIHKMKDVRIFIDINTS